MEVKIIYVYFILISSQEILSAVPSEQIDAATKKSVQIVQSHMSHMEELEQVFDTWQIEYESTVKHSIFELEVLLMVLGVSDKAIAEFHTLTMSNHAEIQSSIKQYKYDLETLQKSLEFLVENLQKHKENVASHLTFTNQYITDVDTRLKRGMDALKSLNITISKQVNKMLVKQSGILADEVHYHVRLLQEILNSENDKLEHQIKKYASSKNQMQRQLRVASRKINNQLNIKS